MKELPERAGKTFEMAGKAATAKAERYRYMDRCVVIGRGFSYGIALEIALKLKELTYVTADPYSSADFLHGPMAMIDPFFRDPGGPQRHAPPAHERVSAGPAFRTGLRMGCRQRLGSHPWSWPKPGCRSRRGLPEWLSPILAVIPGRLPRPPSGNCEGL